MLLTRRSASSGRAMRSWHIRGDAIGLFYGLLGTLKERWVYWMLCLWGVLLNGNAERALRVSLLLFLVSSFWGSRLRSGRYALVLAAGCRLGV
jgi:hypothetical protein